MAEGEVTALKETLSNQSLIMKKLYTELEEERKASATAVEEALSMIWRLQQEKAAEKLEACQYKRMAEEKMHHDEESLGILEEALFEKEIEVASLKYHIQAYKQKLLRNSINNRDIETLRILEYPFTKSCPFLEKRSFLSSVRRNISMPATSLEQLCSAMDIIDEDSYLLDEFTTQLNGKYDESQTQNLSVECVTKESNSYREQADKENIRVQEFSQTRNSKKVRSESISPNNEIKKTVEKEPVSLGAECRFCPCYSAVNSDVYDSTEGGIRMTSSDEVFSYLHSQAEDPENISAFEATGSCLKTELNGNTSNKDTRVLESHSYCVSESYKQVLQKPCLEATKMTTMPHSMPQEDVTCFLRGDGLPASREGTSMNYRTTVVDPKNATASSQSDVEQLKKCLQQLETEIRIMKQEYYNSGKEQLKLVREIHDQISTIQSEIKESKFKKCRPQDDSLVPLMEAMLTFWL